MRKFMADLVRAGTWVEIYSIVLPAEERAAHIPDDTRRVPLEMRVRGFLVADAALGAPVEIATAAGRRLRGTLAQSDPSYTHGFGPPIAELQTIGGEVRALLHSVGGVK